MIRHSKQNSWPQIGMTVRSMTFWRHMLQRSCSRSSELELAFGVGEGDEESSLSRFGGGLEVGLIP
jgi:hypothetical protein